MFGLDEPPTWTPERVQQLKDLVGEGLSSGAIGRKMGLTRNSIISKIMRMGLRLARRQNEGDRAARLAAKRLTTSKEAKRPAVRRAAPPMRPAPVPKRKPGMADPGAMKETAVLLTASRLDQCRYPVGDWSAPIEHKHVCGAPVVYGTSWCGGHLGVVEAEQGRKSRESNRKRRGHG